MGQKKIRYQLPFMRETRLLDLCGVGGKQLVELEQLCGHLEVVESLTSYVYT